MHVLSYGVNVLRHVMHVLRYGIGCFRHCATILGIVRFFRKNEFLGRPRGQLLRLWIIYTPGDFFITRADTDMT